MLLPARRCRCPEDVEYLERRDNNPYFLAEPQVGEWRTRGGFAELVYLPLGPDGRWSLAGLYNIVSSNDPEARYQSLSAAVGRLLARNLRLTIEGDSAQLRHNDVAEPLASHVLH